MGNFLGRGRLELKWWVFLVCSPVSLSPYLCYVPAQLEGEKTIFPICVSDSDLAAQGSGLQPAK